MSPVAGAAGTVARAGETACCRFVAADDRRRLVGGVVARALRREDRVVHLFDPADHKRFALSYVARDEILGQALGNGQMALYSSATVLARHGRFDVDRALAWWSDQCELTDRGGYERMTVTAEIGASFGPGDAEAIAEYEQRLDQLALPSVTSVCLNGHAATGAYDLDLAPGLAALGRAGVAEGGWMRGGALRLAGELDFEGAASLAGVLRERDPGPLVLDLADLRYVDVAGMRALRGRPEERTISLLAASAPVRTLLALMALDTDPGVQLPPA